MSPEWVSPQVDSWCSPPTNRNTLLYHYMQLPRGQCIHILSNRQLDRWRSLQGEGAEQRWCRLLKATVSRDHGQSPMYIVVGFAHLLRTINSSCLTHTVQHRCTSINARSVRMSRLRITVGVCYSPTGWRTNQIEASVLELCVDKHTSLE